MTKGVVLIARNNKEIDYIKQAIFLAKRIKKYLDLPTALITDNKSYVEKHNGTELFDRIIEVNDRNDFSIKKYRDGSFYNKSLEFKNTNRSSVYDLTPYNETLLIDTDLIISDDILKNCFTQSANLMMYSRAFELTGWRDTSEFDYISDAGPKFYWATAVFFRKSDETNTFFELIKHIQENWFHYRKLYQISSPVFRNDFVFSIAAHIMNGYTTGNFVKEMPGTLYYTADKDELIELKDDEFLFLLEKENDEKHFPAFVKGKTVHVMNKYSLGRIIDDH